MLTDISKYLIYNLFLIKSFIYVPNAWFVSYYVQNVYPDHKILQINRIVHTEQIKIK